MEFNLSKIEMSKRDSNRGIKFPERLTNELAEFIGIMIGDGHLGLYYKIDKKGHKSTKSDIKISGNKAEETYLKHIMNLFYRLFNIELQYKPDSASNSVLLTAHSKGIVQFLDKICGVPINRKTDSAIIPEIIKNSSDDIRHAFLRGLADTDFSVTFKNRTNKGHNYPVISGGFKSEKLIRDLEMIFNELGFKYCVVYDGTRYDHRISKFTVIHTIHLNGRNVRNFPPVCDLIVTHNSLCLPLHTSSVNHSILSKS